MVSKRENQIAIEEKDVGDDRPNYDGRLIVYLDAWKIHGEVVLIPSQSRYGRDVLALYEKFDLGEREVLLASPIIGRGVEEKIRKGLKMYLESLASAGNGRAEEYKGFVLLQEIMERDCSIESTISARVVPEGEIVVPSQDLIINVKGLVPFGVIPVGDDPDIFTEKKLVRKFVGSRI